MLTYGKGRIQREPYLSYSTEGKAFAFAQIREEWIDGEGKTREGAFVQLVAFGGVAEELAEQTEGTMIDIKGQLRFRENDYYTSDKGTHPYEAQVVVQSLEVKEAAVGKTDEFGEELPF